MKLLNKLMSMMNELGGKNENQQMLDDMKQRAQWLGVTVKYMEDLKQSAVLFISSDYNDDIATFEVLIRPGMTVQEELMALAHELGHAWQFLGECDASMQEWILYKEINNILLIESDAWLRGVKLLHEVGFKQWEVFRLFAIGKYATYCISEYKDKDKASQAASKFLDDLDAQIKKEVMYA